MIRQFSEILTYVTTRGSTGNSISKFKRNENNAPEMPLQHCPLMIIERLQAILQQTEFNTLCAASVSYVVHACCAVTPRCSPHSYSNGCTKADQSQPASYIRQGVSVCTLQAPDAVLHAAAASWQGKQVVH